MENPNTHKTTTKQFLAYFPSLKEERQTMKSSKAVHVRAPESLNFNF
jgi:hypothetical protein